MDCLRSSRPHFNWFYILTILVISCGGIPKGEPRRYSKLNVAHNSTGYDEGGYSSSVRLPSFQHDFDVVPSEWSGNPTGLADRVGNITSLASLGSAFGALVALYLNDRVGRLTTWRWAGLFWASGAIMQTFASGIYGFLLFARIWMGIGAGALTAASPMFLAEIAGTKARGLVVSCYMAMLLLWFALGKSYTPWCIQEDANRARLLHQLCSVDDPAQFVKDSVSSGTSYSTDSDRSRLDRIIRDSRITSLACVQGSNRRSTKSLAETSRAQFSRY